MKDALNASLAALRPIIKVNDSDTKAAMDEFERANQDAIDKMKAADERLTAAMASLTRQLNEQSTTIEGLNKTLTELNAARDRVVEAERRFGEILTNFTRSVVDAFGELVKKPGLFGFGGIFGDLLNEIKELGGDAWDIVKDVIREAAKIPGNFLDDLLGGLGDIFIVIAIGLCIIAVALCAYLKCQINALERKIDMISATAAGRAPVMQMGTMGRSSRRKKEQTPLMQEERYRM
jgi:uncharacterized coiled-coil protein SlyX